MKKTLLAVAMLATVLVPAPAAQAATDCPFPGVPGIYHKGTAVVNHRNLANVIQYSLKLVGETCTKNGEITYKRFTKSKYVNPSITNDWHWRYWEEDVDGGCVGCNHVYKRVQGFLELCIKVELKGITCVRDARPWIALTGRTSEPWFNVGVSEGT